MTGNLIAGTPVRVEVNGNGRVGIEPPTRGDAVFSAVAAYAYAAEWLSRWAALVVAVAYVYVPYHLVNAYYRGDLPEFAAMAWFPALLWAFSRLARPIRTRRDWIYLPVAALAYAGLVITHNLSAFIYTGLLVVYCGWLLLVNRLEGNYRSLPALAAPAARLMGAECIISGIRPQIAQTIVALGIEFGDIATKASLADALRHVLRQNDGKTGRRGAGRRES